MKEGFVIPKNEETSDEDIKLINKFTKRDLNKNEVYVFSLVLCDNEIDRENEQFTTRSLEKLSYLFVGKTGILDHDAKSEKQYARIFSCHTEIFKEKNSLGENYCRLVAKAYIPKTKSNEDLIVQIDAGIKKEVSIRCLIEKTICSVCKDNIKTCKHKKGEKYKYQGLETTCYAILENPIDAYEWSFVAIPSQTSAGVIKTFSKNNQKSEHLDDVIKELKKGTDKNNIKKIYKIVEQLEDDINVGRKYISDLKNYVIKRFSIMNPKIDNLILNRMVDSLEVDDLEKIKKNFLSGDIKVQFSPSQNKNNSNYQFKI